MMTNTTDYTPTGNRYAFAYPIRHVRGDWCDEHGYIDNLGRSRIFPVHVSPDGRAYETEFGIEVQAEVWTDTCRLGRNFLPDTGELARCGIVPTKCGNATDADAATA